MMTLYSGITDPFSHRCLVTSGQTYLALRGVSDGQADQLGHAGSEVVVQPGGHVSGVVGLEQRGGVGHHPGEFGEPRAARSLGLFPLGTHRG